MRLGALLRRLEILPSRIPQDPNPAATSSPDAVIVCTSRVLTPRNPAILNADLWSHHAAHGIQKPRLSLNWVSNYTELSTEDTRDCRVIFPNVKDPEVGSPPELYGSLHHTDLVALAANEALTFDATAARHEGRRSTACSSRRKKWMSPRRSRHRSPNHKFN